MAGELTIKDWSANNVALINVTGPGYVLALDTVNSVGGVVAATFPAAALAQPLGVSVDKSKLSALDLATVLPGEGLAIRTWGMVWVVVAGAVAVGDMLSIADTSGRVQTQARTAGGSQPVPVVGRALTAASAINQSVICLLMIGSTY